MKKTFLKTKLGRLAAYFLIFLVTGQSVFASTWYVDTNADNDPNTCTADENTDDDNCTFRDAVSQAVEGDSIEFLASEVITNLGGAYSLSTNGVTVTGNSSSLDGNDTALGGGSFNGLVNVQGDNVTVDGFSIYNSAANGVVVSSGANGTILSNLIVGLQSDGSTINANATNGILVLGDNTTIEDSTISGNTGSGIQIWGDDGGGGKPQDVYIHDNKIGVDGAGTADKGNGSAGVEIKATSDFSLSSGEDGVDPGDIDLDSDGNFDDGVIVNGNALSGNTNAGFWVGESSSTLTGTVELTENAIGLADNLGSVIANDTDGVAIDNGSLTSITVGETDLGNYIGGNTQMGVDVRENSTATVLVQDNVFGLLGDDATAAANGDDNISLRGGADLTIDSNVVTNSAGDGIEVSEGGGTTLTVTGNKIGTLADGVTAAGNTGVGIRINSVALTSVLIGYDLALSTLGNVIAANGDGGILVEGVLEAVPVLIKGNYIGVGGDGETIVDDASVALANDGMGILVHSGAPTIGGYNGLVASDTLFEGNVISTNVGDAISLWASDLSTIGNSGIYGNIIGLVKSALTGDYDTDAGNMYGISVGGGAPSNAMGSITIGGTDADFPADPDNTSRRNIVSGQTNEGIKFSSGTQEDGANVTIKNNYIGTDISGTIAVGNTQTGVALEGGTFNEITFGGTTEADRNIVSANGVGAGDVRPGISIGDDIVVDAVNILGNYIGLDATGAVDLGNYGNGLSVDGGTVNIGFDLVGEAYNYLKNVISGNEEAGVNIDGGTVSLRGNYIGLDATGEIAMGNGSGEAYGSNQGGVQVMGGTVVIGGSDLTDADTINVISGNYGQGIALLNTIGAIIDGNYIGTDKDGTTDVGNVDGAAAGQDADVNGAGILVWDGDVEGPISTDGTIIGGAVAGTNGNVVSGNAGPGIAIVHSAGGGGQDWTGGYIKNNLIGLAADGVTSLLNDSYGIYVEDTEGETNITNLQIGGSVNKVDTTSNYGVYLKEVMEAGLSGGYSWVGAHNTFTNTQLTWQAIVGGESQIVECSDGVDNDGDGQTDTADSGCENAVDTDEGAAPVVPVILSTGGSGAASNDSPEKEQVTEEKAEEEPELTPEQKEKAEGLEDAANSVLNVLSDLFAPVTPEADNVVPEKDLERALFNFENPRDTVSGEEEGDVAKKVVYTEEQKVVTDALRVGVSTEEAKMAVNAALKTAVENGDGLTLRQDGKEIAVEDAGGIVVAFSAEEAEALRKELEEKGEEALVITPQTMLSYEEGKPPISLYFAISHGYDLTKPDSDGDGLDIWTENYIGTNPNVPDGIDQPQVANVDGNTVGTLPQFRIASEDDSEEVTLLVVKMDSKGNPVKVNGELDKKVLGMTTTEDQKGSVVPSVPLEEGKYFLIPVVDEEPGKISTFTVDAEADESSPELVPEMEFANTQKCDLAIDANLKDVNMKVDYNCSLEQSDKKNMLVRGFTDDKNSQVYVTFKSAIFSSIVISDASQGYFEVEAPADLAEGPHEVIVYTYDEAKKLMSNAATLFFIK